jgi:hypothetical protein
MAKKKAPKNVTLSKSMAHALMDAHEVWSCLDSPEEIELLEENNPELYDAYITLRAIANQDE